MAVVEVQGEGPVNLSTAQTGNGDSTNIARRGIRGADRPGAIVITSTVGATPTVTVNIQGSVDGVNYVNVPYAVQGTFTGVYVVAALTITTATTQFYMLQPNWPYRFVKLALSANTNVTLTADAYL